MIALMVETAAPLLSGSLNHSQSVSNWVPSGPSTVSFPASSPMPPLIYCGRGDKKTAKGKRFRHSFGNARPRDKKKGRGPDKPPVPPSPTRKDRFDENDC